MAAPLLPEFNAMFLCHNPQVLDAPIERIVAHPFEDLYRIGHYSMVSRAVPRIKNDEERGSIARQPAANLVPRRAPPDNTAKFTS